MKRILFILTLVFIFQSPVIVAQEDARITEIFRNAYSVYENLRSDVGMYQSKLDLVNNASLANASIAVNGMALVTVCIADSMGWITDGEDLVIETLETLLGRTSGFTPDRNPSGFYPHFFNKNTGARANGTSEYSTVDNAVFCAGMLFCKNYFKNHPKGAIIASLANELWLAYDWSKIIVDPSTDVNGGGMYLSTDDFGEGAGNITRPYNEYILAAWLAYNQEKENTASGPAQRLWDKWFVKTENLYKVSYGGYEMLTVKRLVYQAEHTYQMPYYLCHFYTTNQGKNDNGEFGYLHYMLNAVHADKAWFQNNTSAASYEWGMSAGSGINKETGDLTKSYYSVDAINDNPYHIVSPHTMAAFIPVYPQSKNNLISLYENNKGVYGLPWDRAKKVIWRYSLAAPGWEAPKIQGVDFAPLIFGIASLPEYCGPNFFARNNDFFDSGYLPTAVNELERIDGFNIYPNPASNSINIEIGNDRVIEMIELFDMQGCRVKRVDNNFKNPIRIKVEALLSGIYLVKIQTQHSGCYTQKLVVQ